MSDRDIELDENERRIIALSHEAEIFWASELGQYIKGMAENSKAEAYLKLGQVDPGAKDVIERLQNDISKSSNFEQWMTDLITLGDQYHQQYYEGHNE